VFFTLAWHAMSYEERRGLLREIVSSIQLQENAIRVNFQAGISFRFRARQLAGASPT
jgi:hypothetical protein